MQVITETSIPDFPRLSRGKVRDIYEIDPDTLLIVTTDRMSAFDVVLPDPIPFKGAVLNQITLFWMTMFADQVDNHLLASQVSDFPKPLHKHDDQLRGRSVLVRKASPLPVECIVRGYITGSGWKDYQNTGKVSGHVLPNGLLESQELPEPLFTPSTKAAIGEHDENITVEQARQTIGDDIFQRVQELSLSIYRQGRAYARERGIIIADTKFEFGLHNGRILLIDEVLTPDSSRFWPEDEYAPGKTQNSFDKQFLRDWLTQSGWDKTPPAPSLPQDIIDQTGARYFEAFKRLTGGSLE
ncbi:MAG: phosphoribosylaminoimidazolesuccinocarboxamide synthase [Desulfohalobiaceae bacterium]